MLYIFIPYRTGILYWHGTTLKILLQTIKGFGPSFLRLLIYNSNSIVRWVLGLTTLKYSGLGSTTTLKPIPFIKMADSMYNDGPNIERAGVHYSKIHHGPVVSTLIKNCICFPSAEWNFTPCQFFTQERSI